MCAAKVLKTWPCLRMKIRKLITFLRRKPEKKNSYKGKTITKNVRVLLLRIICAQQKNHFYKIPLLGRVHNLCRGGAMAIFRGGHDFFLLGF